MTDRPAKIDTSGFFPCCLLEVRYGDGWIAVDTAYALVDERGGAMRRIDWLLDSDLYNEMDVDGDEERKFNSPDAPRWLAYGLTPADAVANLRVKSAASTIVHPVLADAMVQVAVTADREMLPMTDSMIERVRRAIESRRDFDDETTEMAKAAIAAMRAPTDAMIRAGDERVDAWFKPPVPGDYSVAWFNAMIDAALKES